MTKIHAKSSCCRARIRWFGGRRRQCIQCYHTWRIRPHRRGRKRHRTSSVLALNYLSHAVIPMRVWAHLKRCAPDRLERRLIRSRSYFIHTTSFPSLPATGPLLILADAMIECIAGSWYTIYFILIKRPYWHTAIITPPVIVPGKETEDGWRATFVALPHNTHRSIQAIICDGHRGILRYARHVGWHIQRCHIHLLRRLNGRRSRSPWSRHRVEGKRLYALVSEAITTDDTIRFSTLINDIEELGWDTTSPQLRIYIDSFLNQIDAYRTYLTYPALRLPTTTNTIECFIGIIHMLKQRARGFRTIHALSAWIEAIVKHRRTITCNSSIQPNKCG